MIDSTGFTDEEVKLIRHEFRKGLEQGRVFLLFITPLICAIGPYIPGRKSGPLIDRMDYADAFFRFTILWTLIVLLIWVWQEYKYSREFSALRPFLTRTQHMVKIKRRSQSAFSLFPNRLVTNLPDSLPYIPVTKAQSQIFHPGDKLLVEVEEQTWTVLKIEKRESSTS